MKQIKQKRNEIIKKLVSNRFNIEIFKQFTARVINTTVRNRTIQKEPKEYTEYIEYYQIVEDYEDKEGKKIYVIAVKTKDKLDNGNTIDPTKARTKQRNFVANLLKGNDKIPMHDAALVSFYNDVSNSWRLSFIKLDYSFTFEGIKEKLTPAKRYSYILGKNEATHTAEKQLNQLVKNNEEATLEQLENIFQIEKVTKEFFDKYKEKYLELKEHLEKDKEFVQEALKHTEKVEEFSEEFSKKLMGQLAFLYFLQKKGWLGVKAIHEKLNKEQFEDILKNKTPSEKELLNNLYKRINKNEYKSQKEVIENLDDNELDIIMNCFKNTPFEGKWGDGEKNFVRKLFEHHKRFTTNKNFFNDYLEYLFYEALNTYRGENQYYKKFNCKIPFLNGGLFEPYEGYDWKTTNFHIPDTIFSNEKEEGILDIFDRYNFTIAENEPYETEIAVDPEMLGKVFENLLDVKDRKFKGAFYTPREIVYYMCKESLINYLDNEIEEVEREKFEELLQIGEFVKEYDTHIFEMEYKNGKKVKDEEWGIHISIFKNIHKIDKALKNVKIADPAIGSGAFPLGMLIEIVKVRNVLTEYFIIHEYFRLKKDNKLDEFWNIKDKLLIERSLYNLKIETIKNSLFGVDIEPSAVEIAKLRLWLSIVVDSENNNINPLPNLDFNLMVGNSLLDEFEGINLFDEKLLNKEYKKKDKIINPKLFYTDFEEKQRDILSNIKALHKNFFIEKNSLKKKQIKESLNSLEWELIKFTLSESGNKDKIKELEKLQKEKRKPYFLWKLEFAEVFKEKGGFDIVIGNPPYIGERKNKKIFIPVQNSNFGKKYYIGKMDFWYFFTSLGLNILKNKGTLNFIAPNNWLTTFGGKKMRNHIMKDGIIKQFINFGDYMVFENAAQQTMIFLIEKDNKSKEYIVDYREVLDKNIEKNELNLFLGKNKNKKFKYYSSKISKNNFKKDDNIKLLDNKTYIIINKIKKNKNIYLKKNEIAQGIVVPQDFLNKKNANILNLKKGSGIFVLTNNELKNLNLSENEINTLIRPYYTTNEIKKYYTNNKNKFWIIYTKPNINNKINKFPNIKKHLDLFLSINTSDNKPYGLHRSRNENFFKGEKIISLRKCSKPTFSFNNFDCYISQSFFSIKTIRINLKYLTGILNSKLIEFWLRNMGKMQGNTYQIDKEPLMNIPIKVKNSNQKIFIKIVNQIIELKKQKKDTTELENKIDEMVYDLYELTEEEKEIVRNFNN
ncbi:hypothetical protein OSSY52_02480 [Tepiditoga spiralis]|uniref:site-specific DNA-methyltransferase (adenine-specific) n=1 Tax=Tepiditoga spiralis TaxID=2108365 RepID=A0A7G1G5E0_9BACT|nr:TaqI-like C-terminal specificity domain-containing protein [Tepiditoga spiralis]BBE30107.1 hypothetical protein OSSY52_02480 [Tepiditoga spiralis]